MGRWVAARLWRPSAVWITDVVSTCETHPTEAATGACARCGRFVCHQCDRGEAGRIACPVCAALRRRGGSARASAGQGPRAGSGAVMVVAPRALAPNPFPPKPPSTRAQRLAWLPISGAIWALMLAASASLAAVLVAIPLGAASIYGGVRLWRRHVREVLEQRALKFFRALTADQVTKDEAVKDHGLDPGQADQVLTWLVGQELLVPDWEELDRPVIYRRQRG